jgi:hypothetical protein
MELLEEKQAGYGCRGNNRKPPISAAATPSSFLIGIELLVRDYDIRKRRRGTRRAPRMRWENAR